VIIDTVAASECAAIEDGLDRELWAVFGGQHANLALEIIRTHVRKLGKKGRGIPCHTSEVNVVAE